MLSAAIGEMYKISINIELFLILLTPNCTETQMTETSSRSKLSFSGNQANIFIACTVKMAASISQSLIQWRVQDFPDGFGRHFQW